MHIQQQGVGFQRCMTVSAQREPASYRRLEHCRVEGEDTHSMRCLFPQGFRWWQALVLGTLHLCVGLFLPEQSWGLSNLNVDERSGREGNPRAEAWSLVGKVKDWEGGRKGAKREWALVRSWQRAKALDRGQKSEGWGQEKRLEHGGVRLWIKAHRFEGVRAAWGGEQRRAGLK